MYSYVDKFAHFLKPNLISKLYTSRRKMIIARDKYSVSLYNSRSATKYNNIT